MSHVWRADITGLRAVAVIPVVIYHAFPEWIPGGFTGVDIFFVISGFLISGILFRSLETTGSVNYADFYAKRIRRILPNLILLLVAVAAVGWVFMTPSEYATLGRQIYSSATFWQNFRLMKTVGDYFAPSVTETPLLHLWSLAIEEQFYIVFPLLLWLVWRLKRGAAGIGILCAAVTLGSFVLCLATKNAVWRFYFPLTRFWELGAGILLSYAMTFGALRVEALSKGAKCAASFGGLGLLLAGFAALSEGSTFPGLGTLLPVLGSILLILAGPEAPVNRVLSWRLPVFIGLVSYSLYLWHWPILSFLTLNVGTPSTNELLWALGAAFVISVLVYVAVENPVRRMSKGRLGRNAVIALLVGLLLCFAWGQTTRAKHGFMKRDIPIVKLAEFERDWHYDDILEKQQINGVEVRVTPGVEPKILFVGDSHSEQYSPRVLELAKATGVGAAYLTVPGCLTVPGIAGCENGDDKGCKKFGPAFEKLLETGRFERIVWGNMFGRYLHEHTPVTALADLKRKAETATSPAKTVRTLDEGGFDLGIQNFLALKRALAPNVPLTILLDVPWMDVWKNHYQFQGISRLEMRSIDQYVLDGHKERHWREGNECVRAIVGNASDVSFISPVGLICPEERCPYSFYKDDNHLRAGFVRQNATWLDALFQH